MSDCRTEGCLYPPAFTVHWPGSIGLMCLPCTERARGTAHAMGFGLPVEPWPVAASVFREPLTNPGPLVPLPEHPPAPNGEDLVDLELDRLKAENAELRRALAAVVPMAREADPTGCAAEVVEAEGALGMSVGQAMDYYRTQVEASARVELADLRARLEASEGTERNMRAQRDNERANCANLRTALDVSERGAAAMRKALERNQYVRRLVSDAKARCPECGCTPKGDGGDGHDEECLVFLALASPVGRDFADAARHFGSFKPRKNPSGAYAVALRQLVDAARVFATKSDEEWAEEVVAAREGREADE